MESEFSMLKGIPYNAKYEGSSVFTIKISMEEEYEKKMIDVLNFYLTKREFLRKEYMHDYSDFDMNNAVEMLKNIEENEIKSRMMENGILCDSRIIGVKSGSVDVVISLAYYSFDAISKFKNFKDSIKIIDDILKEIFSDFTIKCFGRPIHFSISAKSIEIGNVGVGQSNKNKEKISPYLISAGIFVILLFLLYGDKIYEVFSTPKNNYASNSNEVINRIDKISNSLAEILSENRNLGREVSILKSGFDSLEKKTQKDVCTVSGGVEGAVNQINEVQMLLNRVEVKRTVSRWWWPF